MARIQCTAREKQNISWEGHKIGIFPDYTRVVEFRCKKFRECKRRLHQRGVKFALVYPATLKIFPGVGLEQRFDNQVKALDFINKMWRPAWRELWGWTTDTSVYDGYPQPPGIWLSDWTIKSRSGLVWNNYIVENYSDKILQVSEAQFIYFHISHSLCWLWMTRHIYSIHWDWINLICHPSSSCCNSVSSHS